MFFYTGITYIREHSNINLIYKQEVFMMQKSTIFLIFAGNQRGKAKEAIDFYTSTFKNSELKHIEYFEGNEHGGRTGEVKHAVFSIAGQKYMAMDAMDSIEKDCSFNHAVSINFSCDAEEEINTLYSRLLEGGSVLMPLDNYGFGKKFGWLSDKYGVSWQVDLR